MHEKHVTPENVQRLHDKVYGKILSKYNLGSVGKDVHDAKRISYFLNLIKSGVQSSSTDLEKQFLRYFTQAGSSTYSYKEIQSLLSDKPTTESGSVDVPQLGANLEQAITKIFNRAFNAAAKEMKINIRKKNYVQHTGTASAGVNVLFTEQEMMAIKKELGEKVLFKVTTDEQGKIAYTLVARSQKSDVTVESLGELHIEASPLLKEFVTLIQNSGFSLKNSSHFKGNAKISFGYAINYYRAYGAILSYLKNVQFNQQGLEALYTKTKTDTNLLTHHAHLRFAYEIGGFGQTSSSDIKKLLTTRFIIINRVQGGAIAVFSTRDIIRQILKNKNLIRYGSLTLTESGKLKV